MMNLRSILALIAATGSVAGMVLQTSLASNGLVLLFALACFAVAVAYLLNRLPSIGVLAVCSGVASSVGAVALVGVLNSGMSIGAGYWCLVVAAWMRYVGGVDENGQPIDVRDPLVERLRAASDSATDAAGKVAAFLELQSIFGSDLPDAEAFRTELVTALERLQRDGAFLPVCR